MKNFFQYLAPFAPDYSGAAAVFYGLGALTVICDPGGCSGNVCGYDEPRFYEEGGPLFSAAIRDMDTIFGKDDKLVDKIADACEGRSYPFIALVGTPVVSVIATDLEALCSMVEKRTGIAAVSVDTNGMDLYDKGVQKAWKALERRFPGRYPARPVPLDSMPGQQKLDKLRKKVQDLARTMRDKSPQSVQGMGQDATRLVQGIGRDTTRLAQGMGQDATRLAQGMGQDATRLAQEIGRDLSQSVQEKGEDSTQTVREIDENVKILIIHQVQAANLLREHLEKNGLSHVTCATWFSKKGLRDGDLHFQDEEVFIEEANRYDILVGDPLYFRIPLREEIKTVSFPHLAVSGDIFLENQ